MIASSIVPLCFGWLIAGPFSHALLSQPSFPPTKRRRHPARPSLSGKRFSTAVGTATAFGMNAEAPTTPATSAPDLKEELLELLRRVPPNVPTPELQARRILDFVRQLEALCPTPDVEVAAKLQGSWELLWTGQDRSSPLSSLSPLITNPIENQAFSNNPMVRIHPSMLPKILQRRLERAGFITTSSAEARDELAKTRTPAASIRSTQLVDVNKGKVRNVVSFGLRRFRRRRRARPSLFKRRPTPDGNKESADEKPEAIRASMAISIDFAPDAWDARRIHVKCQSCQFAVPSMNIDWEVPLLGAAGPMGWMRTQYVDDDFRIARGHKGTVFVLRRPA